MEKQEFIDLFKKRFKFETKLTFILWWICMASIIGLLYYSQRTLMYKSISFLAYTLPTTALCYGYYKSLKNDFIRVCKFAEDEKFWEKVKKIDENQNKN